MIYLYLFGTCFHFIYVFMIICNIVKPVSQYGNEKDYHIIWRFCITDES